MSTPRNAWLVPVAASYLLAAAAGARASGIDDSAGRVVVPFVAVGGGLDTRVLVTNHRNYSGYSGVITSELFGRPTSASAARRVHFGTRFWF